MNVFFSAQPAYGHLHPMVPPGHALGNAGHDVIAALSYGLPVLAIPLGADGPRTAARCEQMGMGRMLQPEGVVPGAVSTLVTGLLTNPRFGKAAAGARAEMEQMPSPKEVVQLIEAIFNLT